MTRDQPAALRAEGWHGARRGERERKKERKTGGCGGAGLRHAHDGAHGYAIVIGRVAAWWHSSCVGVCLLGRGRAVRVAALALEPRGVAQNRERGVDQERAHLRI